MSNKKDDIKLTDTKSTKLDAERSKREDLDNGPFFPPPWNMSDHQEKTEGWIEFQRCMRKDPEYYLGCGALNTMET